jgi:rare lipoprotein A
MRDAIPVWKVGAALACATLFGCAQLERATESAPATPTLPEAAPVTPPETSITVPAAPATSADTATTEQQRGTKQQRGRISMYGLEFAGRKTASGEPFDPDALTMAHRTLPFGTRVRVTNLENQRSVEVVVNDRGPFASGRIADLSETAARRIDMVAEGVVEALLDVVQLAKRR